MSNRFEKHVPVMQLDEITTTEENLLADLAAISWQTGDLIYWNGSDLVRLPIGTSGYYLKVSGGIPAWESQATLGDVAGPASSTDNAIVLFDGATGKLIKGASVTIDALANMVGISNLGSTGTRVTKGWFTDLEVTNAIAGSITGNAVTITVADTTDSTSFVALFESVTGNLAPKTDAALLYDASTGGLSSTLFSANTITANTAFVPDLNDGASLGTAALAFADIFLATGANILVNNANAKRTIILSGGGGQPTTTIGCGGPTRVEAGTNDVDYFALEFDTTTEERSFWNVQMPDNYDGGTVTAQFVWTNASGGAAETVVWGIKGLSLNNDEAIDQAYGSEVTVSDTWIAQGDVHISDESSAITLAGTPAAGEYVIFNVGRKTGSDTMVGDARLLAVRIKYGINAYSD